MSRFVLDTHLYIEAIRSKDDAKQLKAFVSEALPFIHLHAVVVQELLAGASSDVAVQEIEDSLVRPFEKRDRLIVPSWRSWRRAGEVIAELVRTKRLSPGGYGRSFQNDALIAATLREEGVILITRNAGDYRILREVEPFRFVEPWPA